MNAPVRIMTAKAGTVSYEQFIEAGWTPAQLVEHGYMEPQPAPTDPPAAALPEAERLAKIEAAQATETQEDLHALDEAQEELAAAEAALAKANRPGNEDAAHECRKWLTDAERKVRLCRERLGEIAPTPAPKPGTYVGSFMQLALFDKWVYVNDVHRIVSPSGFLYNEQKFDAHPRFSGREYQMTVDNSRPSRSPWEAFTKSQMPQGEKVHGMVFKPADEPGAILMIEGERYVNTWRPVNIRMVDGDITPFLTHLQILLPLDWKILLNYLKFMMQRKGEKATWWPFIQGAPGNGKSYISDTMEYCIGYKFTQRPTPKNIDSQFNASLYGCLFLALEDVKMTEDYGLLWDTIKPMITQPRIEIQPKGVDKTTRDVCFNALVNSNHKGGLPKTRDDRRIGSFLSMQQRKADLQRDGLGPGYFKRLWDWSKDNNCEGWARVAYFLAHDPIDADFDSKDAPITSSTEEHIRASRTPAEVEIGDAIEGQLVGFRNGWINMIALDIMLRSRNLRHINPQKRVEIIEALGYMPHPALPRGRLTTPLNDGTIPVLYLLPDHPALKFTDPAAIRDTYQLAQA